MGLYARFLMPRIVDAICGRPPFPLQRQKIVPLAEGVVLELGAGGGRNFALYDPGKVTRLIALEPDPVMIARARARTLPGLAVEWIERGAEHADLAPRSIDTIVTTYTLCTIPDVVSALAALRPALKPGGRLLFSEHGLAPDEGVRVWQRRIEPWWKPLGGGCHLTRDILALLASAGFAIDRSESAYLPGAPRFVGFNVWGAARAE